MRESKKSEGGGAFKAPPPQDRIGLMSLGNESFSSIVIFSQKYAAFPFKETICVYKLQYSTLQCNVMQCKSGKASYSVI